MADLATQQKVLHSPFSVERHKETFVNYLEVCIDPFGGIHYAVPSHQEYLIRELMAMHNCSREDALDLVPPEFYCDVMEWLAITTNYIAVWNDHIVGRCNRFQRESLVMLKRAGLYRGDIL